MADEITVMVRKGTRDNTDAEVKALTDKMVYMAENLAASFANNGITPVGINKDGETYVSSIVVSVDKFPTKEGEYGVVPSMTLHSGTELIEIRANAHADDIVNIFAKSYDPNKKDYVKIPDDKISVETKSLLNFLENGVVPEKAASVKASNDKGASSVTKDDNITVTVKKETYENQNPEVQALLAKMRATATKLADEMSERGFKPMNETKDGKPYVSNLTISINQYQNKDGEQRISPIMTLRNGKDTIEIKANNDAEVTFVSAKRFDFAQKTYVPLNKSEMSKETASIVDYVRSGIEPKKEASQEAGDNNKRNGIQIFQNTKLDYVVEDKRDVATKVISKVAKGTDDHPSPAEKLAADLDAHNIVPKSTNKEGKEFNSAIIATVDTKKEEGKEQFFRPMLNVKNGNDIIEVHLKSSEYTYTDKDTGDEKTGHNYFMSAVTVKHFDNEDGKYHRYRPSEADVPFSEGTVDIANHIKNSIELANISYDANVNILSSGDTRLSKDNAVIHEAYSGIQMNDKNFASALIEHGFANDNAKDCGLDCVQFRNHTDKQVVYVGKTPDNELVAVAVNYHERENGKSVSKMMLSNDDLSFITDPQIAQVIQDKVVNSEPSNEKTKKQVEIDVYPF